MESIEELRREIKQLRERQTRMGEACIRINESLDFESVLQEVVDSARSLTHATYGMMTVLDESGRLQDCLASGLTPNQTDRLLNLPEGDGLYEYLGNIREPLRIRDLHSHLRTVGIPEFRPQIPVSPQIAFLATPIRHGGEGVGFLFLAEKQGGKPFTEDDEEILVMFATQAALVITNARRYSDEQRARADLEALIDTSPVGVAVFDVKTGHPLLFNREAVRILNDLRTNDSPPEQLLEILTIRRANGQEISLQELSMAQLLHDGETLRAEEIVMQVPDGRSVTTLVNGTPIHNRDGKIESFVVTLQDMTPLEELERLRAEFLGVVSHELRPPLAAIKGSAATALGESPALDRVELMQFFRIINQQADQMSGLVHDLLDVARIRTGNLKVNTEPAQVTSLVDEARNTFLRGTDRNDIRMELAPELPAVNADRGRVVQVLVNLLLSADKHSQEDSPLRITAVQEGVHVVFSVVDEGQGISARRLPRLFEKIVRIKGNAGRHTDDGSGWGLSICRGIVEAHGGRIWAESKGVGLGTRVSFTIPIAEDTGIMTAGAEGSHASGGQEGRPGRMPIMVVDDDPQTLLDVREILSDAGYLPVATSNPDELEELLKAHLPHLVLLDLVLPGTDGIELMQRIFEKADVPVLFLSAYGHGEAIARALEAGAVDYMVKPFSSTELVARIRAALRTAKAPVINEPAEPFEMEGLTLDYSKRRVTLDGRPVKLTAIEYRLLVELSLTPGTVVAHDHLIRRIWKKGNNRDTSKLRSAVKCLRRKLGDQASNPRFIINEPRVGYRLSADE